MKRILIATDGSACSAEAVHFGVELAAEHEAEVVFVHVAPATDVLPVPGFGLTAGVPRVAHKLTDYDRAPLEEAEQIAEQQGVHATSKLLVGHPADEVVAYADSENVDLIVVGSRGHGALASALLGSVSLRVLSDSKRPVTIVRGLAAAPEGAELIRH
jgi:nucleotide-binding universal stress UspA family protein